MTNKKSSESGNTLIIPLLIVGVLFFVIGVGISGFLTPFLRDALHLSVTESYFTMVNYLFQLYLLAIFFLLKYKSLTDLET
jgi:fucose permease